MAVKTFATGEILTATDTNTYLNNGGLVYIGSTSYSASSAVNVNNVFTSTYRDYLIVGSHSPSVGLAGLNIRLRAAAADQTGANYQYTTARLYTNNLIDAVGSGQTTCPIGNGGIASSLIGFQILMYSPQLSDRTIWQADLVNFESASAGVRWWTMGGYAATYQADGFTIYPGSGNITGQLQVYGYRIP